MKYFSFMPPPHPTQKKDEKVWTNFSPFLSPDLVILQNRHQILWLIFWLNYYWICPQNSLQIPSQYISPNSVTPKNHHWIRWKCFTIFPAIFVVKKIHQICHDICHQIWWFTKTITKFGEKNRTFLIYFRFWKKITKMVTIIVTKFGDSQNPSPNLVKKIALF